MIDQNRKGFTNSKPSFILEKIDKFGYEDRSEPKLASDSDVIVQIKATGICGSDVHYWTHGAIGDFVAKQPLVLGHESAGEVVKVGPKVKNLKVGDRVCIEPGRPCKNCAECMAGAYNLCPDMAFAATPPIDGTLCKYYAMDELFCYKLPEWASYEEGALMEPLSVAVHTAKLAGAEPGKSTIVFGAGPVGLLVAAVAKLGYQGSRVVLVDINEARLQFVEKHFPEIKTHRTNTKLSPREAARELVDADPITKAARGFDCVVDATGALPCIQTGIFSAKPGGVYVQTGMGRDTVDFPISALGAGELTVKGCFRYSWGDFAQSVDFLTRKVIDVKPLITERVPFEEAAKAFEISKSGQGIKTIIMGPQ